MFYVCVHVKTTQDHPEHAGVHEAYAGCWIQADNEDEALEIAQQRILDEPWSIVTVESVDEVDADDYDDDPERLEFYEQALEDGVVIVFHLCPRYSTYFVQFNVEREEDDDEEDSVSISADATVWVSIEQVLHEDPDSQDVDYMAPDFWNPNRVSTAIELAQAVVANEGWTITETIKHFPYENNQLESQPDLAEFVESAEETGVSLVIWDRS